MEEGRTQITVEFNDAAFRHGISEADIRNAISVWLYDDMWDAGMDKHLLIGFDTHGGLLEIMYNVKDEQTINVFHAMKCRNTYLRLLKPR